MSPDVHDIQQLRAFQSALTARPVLGCSFAEVAADFTAAGGHVGGDFHDHFELADGRRAFMLGDVTGHGLPSALVMAVSFGAICEAFRWTDLPCAVMNGLHGLLAGLGERSGGPRLFSATLFLGVLERDGSLKYVSAGHSPGLLLRADGDVERLGAIVPPLGLAEPTHCQSVEGGLRPGDRLLLYSDGILKPDEGMDELVARVQASPATDADELVAQLLADGVADDRTVMILSYRGQDCPEA